MVERQFLHYFELLADAFLEVMLFTDEDGVVIYANQMTERLLGYSPEVLASQQIAILFDEASRRNLRLFFDEFIVKRDAPRIKLQLELQAIHQDGTMIPVQLTMNLLESLDRPHVILLIHDLRGQRETERKLLEAELTRQQFQHRQALSRLNQEWVGMVSHEFRNPLSVIKSSIDLMLRHDARMTAEDRQKQLQRAQTHVLRMNKLMEELLVVSKLNSGQYKMQHDTIDLHKFCETICEDLNLRVKHQLETVYELSTKSILADKGVLQHVMWNLLSNARKYTPEGGQIRLEVHQRDNNVSITVRDSGIGIPDEDQKNLFQPFFRATNTGDIKGTGLGLVIVKKYVDVLNGTIMVESQPGAGATFTVQFPVQIAPTVTISLDKSASPPR